VKDVARRSRGWMAGRWHAAIAWLLTEVTTDRLDEAWRTITFLEGEIGRLKRELDQARGWNASLCIALNGIVERITEEKLASLRDQVADGAERGSGSADGPRLAGRTDGSRVALPPCDRCRRGATNA